MKTRGVVARTVELRDETDVFGVLARPDGRLWRRDGLTIAAWGEHVRIPVERDRTRFQRASADLDGVWETISWDEGAPPIAYGSFSFDESSPDSILVVPSAWITSDDAGIRLTTLGDHEVAVPRRPPTSSPDRIRYAGSTLPETEWLEAVDESLRAIDTGALQKVVLCRDVLVWSKSPFDLPSLVERLCEAYPACYVFACDGLVGASPELLARTTGGVVSSIVLAGTAARGGDGDADDLLGAALLASDKDLREHDFAVASVLRALDGHMLDVTVDGPQLLRLANVQHLATRVEGRALEATKALEVVGWLHPTAAVCGTPTQPAMDIIRSSERMDRGRYTGPVGWMDATGAGEWAIALRCGQFQDGRGRIFAGSGIVEGSEPERELEETRLKLRAIRSALEGRTVGGAEL
ncbi:MAG TPA: isochorismate synthase [Actinomycetota bacterium]|nr:isochorismate synthase [Actinomycetota bacterium]